MKYVICNEVLPKLTTKDMEDHKLYYIKLDRLESIARIIYIDGHKKLLCHGLSSSYYTIRDPKDVLYDQIKEIKQLVIEV